MRTRPARTPVTVEVTAFKLNAQKIAPETNDRVAAGSCPGRIGSGRSDPGKFDYKGNVVLKPLAAEGRLEVAVLPRARLQGLLRGCAQRRHPPRLRELPRHGPLRDAHRRA
jgi:hypothetical protein